MNEVRGETRDGKITIFLSGRVDSANAREVEQAVREITEKAPGQSVVIDAEALKYLSSAGLRVILRLRQQYADLRIIGVNSEVYEIFEMTGFTEMMSIEKAYRTVSVEGAEEIGRGANGTVYRIDEDNVVKVYNNADALEEIRHEREVARKALVLGIPTAISYDIVKVGGSYGSVFELLNARPFSKILADEPEKMDWCVEEYVKLLEKIHSTLVPKGDLPDIRETVIGWGKFMQDYLPPEAGKKLLALIRAVPQDDHMIHGDYHTKNVELTGDEVLLIDMDTLAVGHPVFELASMYNAFIGYSEYKNDTILEFQGFDLETSKRFWHKVLAMYLHTDDEEKIRSVEDKARIIGYTRMIRRSIRRKGLETEEGRAEIELWKKELLELLDRTDTLVFNRNEIRVEATKENLSKVTDFIETLLDEAGCPLKTKMQISIAVEEIYINVANYAYAPGTGDVTVTFEATGTPRTAVMRFIDSGIPYDPLAKNDPDVTRTAEEREIGGLGVFIVKKTMDDLYYEYKDGQNILTMKKKLQ